MRITAVMTCPAGPADAQGFVNRDRLVLDALTSHHEVTVIGVASAVEDVLEMVDLAVVDPALLHRPTSRRGRAARVLALRIGWLSGRERRLRSVIASTNPDVIVVFALWNFDLVRCARRVAPTAFFAEERLGRSRVSGAVRGVSLSRLLRDAELASASGLPAVVVLKDDDREWASARFSSPVVVVPHGIDVGYWETAGPDDGEGGAADVVVVANLTMERSAEPLAQIIDRLAVRGWPTGLRLRLVSAAGYHPLLLDRAGPGVELVGTVADPRPIYRSAIATLVPAFEANGIKNGIIQGWAVGCPVITTPASADTVGGCHEVDMLIGADPDAVAMLLAGLGDRHDLDTLVSAGRAHLAARFSRVAHDAAALDLIDALARH